MFPIQGDREKLQTAREGRRSSAEPPHRRIKTVGNTIFFPSFFRKIPPNHDLNKFPPGTEQNRFGREGEAPEKEDQAAEHGSTAAPKLQPDPC